MLEFLLTVVVLALAVIIPALGVPLVFLSGSWVCYLALRPALDVFDRYVTWVRGFRPPDRKE